MSNFQDAVFIGGPFDGATQRVDVDLPYWEIVKPEPFIFTGMESLKALSDFSPIVRYIYERKILHVYGDIIIHYILKGLTGIEVWKQIFDWYGKKNLRVNDRTLDEIFHLWRLSTPSPVNVIQVPEDADPVEWFQDCLNQNISQEVYGLASGSQEDIENGEYKTVAITGNGPTSLNNANFYAMCHSMIPLLIDEIHRLKTKLENK